MHNRFRRSPSSAVIILFRLHQLIFAGSEFIHGSLDGILLENDHAHGLVIEADLLIAATDSDETNILSCMVGRKLGARHTIARVRQEEHYREVVLLREELGLSLTINPGYAAANEISRLLRFPSAAKVEPFAKGQAELVELRLTENNPLCGTSLRDYHSRFGDGTLVCAVRRGEDVHIPGGDFVLAAGDTISIAGAPRNIHALFRALSIFKKGAKYVMIVGGSRIAAYLSRQLLEMGIHVKLIEKDTAFQQELKQMLKYDLYTFVNSNTMNGVTSDTRVVRVHPWWETTLTAVNWATGILAVAACAWYVSSALTKKEKQ